MGMLADIINTIESYNASVEKEVKRVRSDPKAAQEVLDRWQQIRASIPVGTTPTGIKLPRLALPDIDEAGEIIRFLMGEGLPGEFPYVNSAYRELYLEPVVPSTNGNGNGTHLGSTSSRKSTRVSTNGNGNGHSKGHNDVGGAATKAEEP